MDARQRRVSVETFATSGAAATALQKVLKQRDDAGQVDPTDEECVAICEKADRDNVYGINHKTDRHGNAIEQGIGSKGHENINHFNSILRYQGKEAYDRAVREIVKRDPERAKKLGLELPRVGA